MRRAVHLAFVFMLFAANVVTTIAAQSPETALERYRAALSARGYDLDHQGVVFETLDGRRLFSHNVDCFFNPASVVKLATSDAAIDHLGPDFRFKTAFYTNGALDLATGDLRGDLIVLGAADPSFATESAFYVARELRARGIMRVTGNLVVKGPLYCNYSADRAGAGAVLKAALDVETWNGAIETAFDRFRMQTGATTFESVTIDGNVVTLSDRATAGLTPLFVYHSVPLVRILKQLNDYSNNWMAHVIGWTIGNAETVEALLENQLGVPSDAVTIRSTSGLGANAMRPRDLVILLRDLHTRLKRHRYDPEAIMPVAGLDPGTLEDRYLLPGYTGAVVAKTGTLHGVSTLAGYMYTRDRGVVLFAILNQGGSPYVFRSLQDDLVREMFEYCGGPAPLAYRRPIAFSDRAGAYVERSPGNIPEAPPVAAEATN